MLIPPRDAHLLREHPWDQLGTTASHLPRGQWAGRAAHSWLGHPSVHLSESWEGSQPPGLPQCLICGSLPPQLDEEEERRKRRREKNKVAAARCRNKKKERTEFLQRVRRAVATVGPGLVL